MIYNSAKRKTSGAESDICFSCAIITSKWTAKQSEERRMRALASLCRDIVGARGKIAAQKATFVFLALL